MRAGLALGIAAYGLWGFAPLFWRQLGHVPALELLGHRIVWGFVFFGLYAVATRRLNEILAIVRDPQVRWRLLATALCVGLNWFVFVYAIMTDRVLDASLGYFINPLLSVALGRFVLGERLQPLQVAAAGLALLGVLVIAVGADGLPWISVAVATSFGLYGLLRKTTNAPALTGSAFETLLLAVPALTGLIWLGLRGRGHLFVGEPSTDALLICTGPVTAVPLLLFVHAAKRLPLTVVGFLQFLAPSLQFVIAVFVFHEPLQPLKLAAFGLVWLGLLLFCLAAYRGPLKKTSQA
ncbi:MAG: EamA family transporter RarD [Nannocystales bacterium]